MGPVVRQSNTSEDGLIGAGNCGIADPWGYQGGRSYGPRLPLLVIPPFARVNLVAYSVTDRSPILHSIDDRKLGRLGDQPFDEKAASLLNMFTLRVGQGRERRRLPEP